MSHCRRFPTGWLCAPDCREPAHDEFLPRDPCSGFVTLDLDDPYFYGQTLPDALVDYAHVHSSTGICVKREA